MNIAGFYPDSISNGEGWRAVLFVSGCPHRCKGCQNQETWDKNYGTPYNEEEIYQKIMENEFLDGLTLSGGEPFLYYQELLPLVRRIKEKGLNVWVYTGFTFEVLINRSKSQPLLSEFLAQMDVLVDGRFIESRKNPFLKFRGSDNQRIIDVPASLQQKKIVLYPLNDSSR